jgi:hypothetical protein
MKLELKSIGYWSLIKVSFIISLIVGFIIGLFFALFVGFIFSVASNLGGMKMMPFPEEGMPSVGILLIIYPFLFGFGGAIINTIIYLIIAFVYNTAAGIIGGIELEFNQLPVQMVAVPSMPPPGYYMPPTPLQSTPSPPPPPPPVEPLPPDITPPPDSQTP